MDFFERQGDDDETRRPEGGEDAGVMPEKEGDFGESIEAAPTDEDPILPRRDDTDDLTNV